MGEHSGQFQAPKQPALHNKRAPIRGDNSTSDRQAFLANGPDLAPPKPAGTPPSLYTAAQRQRRDASIWTPVQGILAPLQFLIFLISLFLVLRYLASGQGYDVAVISILIKTLALYTIMVTGALWEKEVFGQYLLAPAFFWEDVFSFLVIALHTAYLAALIFGIGTPAQQMAIALLAYGTYVINAGQFIWKLRQARLQARSQAHITAPYGSSLPQGAQS